jgi:hypothetical protein
MLHRFIQFKNPLIYINKNTTNQEYTSLFFNKEEWYIINELLEIFQVFVKPSIKLQGQVYITINKAILYIYQIYSKLELILEEYISKIQENENLVS